MADRQKHVLMLLSNPFRPDPRVHKEAKTLTNAGYKVTILCWDRTGKHPKKEMVDGIEIIRTGPVYTGRALGKFSLMLARFWMKAFSHARKIRPDIIHTHDFDTLPLGFDISKFHGARLIYDAHEIYSAMLGPDGQDTRLGRCIDAFEGFLMRRADHVITVNERIAQLLKNKGARVSAVTNCPPLEHQQTPSSQSLRQRFDLSDDFVILYIGVLEPDRFLEESIKAISTIDGVKLVIGGFGSLEKGLIELSRGNENIKLIGPVDPNLVGLYTSECDLIMCVFDPRHNLNNKHGSPNKVFEAMAASKPVLVTKGTFAAELIGREKCGVAIDYDIESFLHSITQLMGSPEIAKTLGQNARKAAEERHNWEAVSKTLLDVYDSLK